ncbi:hypothetical protein AB0368_30310 [Actinoplanes sp. NPDC051475]|uniref:hypothetical protein n=1 Tax=Actinoplanes sp. NPDC051475 TaxID=3157225 RepID=UPI0034510915
MVVDALVDRELRGSFLMDHLPRVRVRQSGDDWAVADLLRALTVLVDECLKHALWRRQQDCDDARLRLPVDWWAPHAPEPSTLLRWLRGHHPAGDGPVRILHPDPPLGTAEREVLNEAAALAGIGKGVEALTLLELTARGGEHAGE